MKARGFLINDYSKKSYADRHLNRMSVARYEQTIRASGFIVVHQKYRCMKGLDFLKYIPKVREIFVIGVTCVLERPSHPGSEA